MASKGPSRRPDLGEMLFVIHDFLARSSDELNLKKGDRVELIERDDEFGDGWFLGRHLTTGSSGLFPEVYTRPAPKTASDNAFGTGKLFGPGGDLQPPSATSSITNGTSDLDATPASLSFRSEAPSFGNKLDAPRSEPAASLRRPSDVHDSSVISDTLNVIDEHITNLRSPSNATHRTLVTDSESEYSAPIDHRMSYIAGEETDEEDETTYTRDEVVGWSADAVAEYLFTSGVERPHCEIFRDQEITGEVLLGMDQGSLFIKALDLGSVGRRLKTWQRIKTLQDEVNGTGTPTRRTTRTYSSDMGSDEPRWSRSRTGTVTSKSRMGPSLDMKRLSQSSRMEGTVLSSPVSTLDSPSRSSSGRPSAASIRDMSSRSRRHSSNDFRLAGGPPPRFQSPSTHSMAAFVSQSQTAAQSAAAAAAATTHKKQPSFDRDWTMGSAYSSRRLSGTGLQDMLEAGELQDSAVDLDRGYFSGGELDGKKRNVLKKRESALSGKSSSYADEQRARSGTTMARQSRFGGSFELGSRESREMTASPAAQRYYGLGPGNNSNNHGRSPSSATTGSPALLPTRDALPPTVTRLDSTQSQPLPDATSPATTISPASKIMDWPAKPGVRTSGGLRALSETVMGSGAKMAASSDSLKDGPPTSPSGSGLATPPSHSLDLGSSSVTKSPGTISTMTTATNKGARKKTKQETSAYLRGLQKTTPREAMAGADYSGWMRKKSSNIMGTWKPRLFVLKGRRLAYYYSGDDEQEKGLIDISFHRVLPADGERLTGLHATITGAGSANLPTMSTAATDDDADVDRSNDSIFIFKLVPPRAGLSRAVNFTKPTVHYFAVPNVSQGRLWMAALVKATIDRDDTQAVTTTYQQKTISLTKARAMHHRPPALMTAEGAIAEGAESSKDPNVFGISIGEADSGVSGLDKMMTSPTDTLSSARFLGADDGASTPKTA